MRICFFNDIDFLGGGEIWVLKACRYLKSFNHDVSVICPHPSALQIACQREDINLFTYSRPLREGYPFYEAVYNFLKDTRVDILYCTVMGRFCEARVLEKLANRLNRQTKSSKLAIILKAGLPPMGDLTPEYYGAGSGRTVRRLHVVSKSLKASFTDWYPKMNNGFIEVFYEGTDPLDFNGKGQSTEEAKKSWLIPLGHKVISCVARLTGVKGQGVLLRAIPDILKEYPRTTFLFAGDGKDRDMLEELMDDLEIGSRVRFLGKIKDVPSLLRATDILCHPSLNDGMPNSIIEAMSMSIPVVASSLPGIKEVITNNESGILVQPNNVGHLRTALLHCLQSDEQQIKMGRNGKKALSGRFNFRVNMDSLVTRLETELEEMRSSPKRKTAPASPKSNLPVGILFVMNTIRTGGEETELGILAKYLDRKRFHLSVLSCFDSDEHAPVFDKLGYCEIPVDLSCYHIHEDDGKIFYIIEKIRRENIGIVVACQDAWLVYQVFKKLSPNECRLIEHGGIVEDANRIPKDHTARYVGVSRQITEAAAKVMVKPVEAVFIPSMVDMDEYDKPMWAQARLITKNWLHQKLLEPHGFSEDTCIVVFVGRLDPKKRVEDFIQAARKLQPDCPDAFFLIVGGQDAFQPNYAKQLVRDAVDLTEKHRLAFTGPRDDIPGLLSACHILVLPSIGEGMAHVINEAGAAGLAVVASDDGAAKEQLEDGKCGLIISSCRVDEMVTALKRLIKDKQLRQKLGNRLRDKVRAEYSADVVIEQWHSLFTSVASELNKPAQVNIIVPDRELPFPLEIQIQTTTACNATCIMCPHPVVSKEVSMGRMKESLYNHILDQCASEPLLQRIEPFLMAEPFVDKRIVDLIALAKEKVPQADVTVTTNGSLVTPAVSDRLVSSGLDAIWFSVNGATKETYEKIMGIPYQEVLDNINYLFSIKPDSLKVLVNMIETNLMQPEIDPNIKKWESRGIEAGSSPLVNRAGNVALFDDLNYMPISKRPIRACELVFHKMYILYNGDVVLCCMDWRRQVVLGNVLKESIRDIWQSEKYKHIRRKLVQRKVSELELCSFCSYTYT